jgi:SSS family solute:Na+ symporter
MPITPVLGHFLTLAQDTMAAPSMTGAVSTVNAAVGGVAAGTAHINLGTVDYIVLIVYFVFVLGIGIILKRFTKSSSDFLAAGRSLPAWICGLAFISANLGAQEVIGMGANGAKYGLMTSHFYWVGAIPAMVFIGVFMMPFYYGSRARSVPEYLKLRFDEKTRGFNAIMFAIMTIFSSGASMYALAKLLNILLGWNFHLSLLASAAIVLVYITMGGLTSAIYNEVLQFFLIVLGFAPIVYLGLKNVGGWHGLVDILNNVVIADRAADPASASRFPNGALTHSWANMGTAHNPMGVDWIAMTFGLGFVLSFGYWCTDFLVVQRAMAAKTMNAARNTPIIAAIPKMLFPVLVILPGMIAIALQHKSGGTFLPLTEDGKGPDYNMATPMILAKFFPAGMLGLGLTALMASFMSGMAGNVTAFNTVFTYDIYQSYLVKGKPDSHYLNVGRVTTVVGILISIAAAYFVAGFNNIMDFLQLVFGFVNAPLFATFLLGMFWRRTTGHGAFWGLLMGTAAAAVHHGLTIPAGNAAGIHGGWIAIVHVYPVDMAQNFWTAIYAFVVCFSLTLIISVATPRLKTDEDLKGLVYSLTPKIKDRDLAWYKQPAILGVIVLLATVVLNIIFW